MGQLKDGGDAVRVMGVVDEDEHNANAIQATPDLGCMATWHPAVNEPSQAHDSNQKLSETSDPGTRKQRREVPLLLQQSPACQGLRACPALVLVLQFFPTSDQLPSRYETLERRHPRPHPDPVLVPGAMEHRPEWQLTRFPPVPHVSWPVSL